MLSVRPEVRGLLEDWAADQRRSISDVVDTLVCQTDTGLEDYFRKQAAFHAFVCAALSTAVASKLLGPAVMREVQERAATTARRLYGRSPTRDFDVEHGLATEEDDPRVRALFLAFGVNETDFEPSGR